MATRANRLTRRERDIEALAQSVGPGGRRTTAYRMSRHRIPDCRSYLECPRRIARLQQTAMNPCGALRRDHGQAPCASVDWVDNQSVRRNPYGAVVDELGRELT